MNPAQMQHVLRSPIGVSEQVLKDACWQAAETLLAHDRKDAETAVPNIPVLTTPTMQAVMRARDALEALELRALQLEQFAHAQEQAAATLWSMLCLLMQLLDRPDEWRDAHDHPLQNHIIFQQVRAAMEDVIRKSYPEVMNDEAQGDVQPG